MADHLQSPSYTSFDGERRLASGPLPTVAVAVKRALERGAAGPVLIFDDRTGRLIDIDTRGSDEDMLARLASSATPEDSSPARADEPQATTAPSRSRGRPKLGVVPREVTLLPRHWEWLATQPGGASVALRKLVDEARRARGDRDRERHAQERAYHFMSAMAGNLPGFEEATRALFAGETTQFYARIATWPEDIRDHAIKLAAADDPQT